MGLRLDVPFVHQDPHRCWYAAVQMVAFYFEAGPRIGLREKKDHIHLEPRDANEVAEVIRLAKAEGLGPVSYAQQTWTESALTLLLRDWGPIWCCGRWYHGRGHTIVLTGVDNGVFFNDPAGKNKLKGEKKESIEWFNKGLAKNHSYCMLHWKRPTKRPRGPVKGPR